jgi:hypothetical protein
LKKEEPLIDDAAIPLFSAQQLKVFDQLPQDEITSKCYEHFTKLATDNDRLDAEKALNDLRTKTFGGWPRIDTAPAPREIASDQHEGVRVTTYEFESQPGINVRFYLARPVAGTAGAVHLEVVDEERWRQELELARAGFSKAFQQEFAAAGLKLDQPVSTQLSQHLAGWIRYIKDNNAAYITFTPRGVGLTALADDPKYRVQVRRRFMLLGQTLAGMQVWDVRRAIQAARTLTGLDKIPLRLHATPEMTEIATFGALFEPGIESLTLAQSPRADKEAPDFLNWSRIITSGQLLQLARARCQIEIEAARRNSRSQ